MTLPSSGQIKWSDIAHEFGGSSPHAMSEYRGSGGTPSSGAIKASDFYNKKIGTTGGIAVSDIGSGSRTAGIHFYSNGNLLENTTATGLVDIGDWRFPLVTGIGSFFDIQLQNPTGYSGSISGSSINTWLNLASDRSWSISANGIENTLFGTILIRNAASGTQLCSISLELSALSL